MIYDRLYQKYDFPKIIKELLTCPGLLRLQEIGQANVPFINFPSFRATRYEHSLGVCHLASLTSDILNLNKKDKTELMIACLYHDVATPPFSHAVEEILQLNFNFDHDKYLYDLLVGKSDDIGREKTQIYLGKSIKLHSVCQKKEAKNIGIDIKEIADLTMGKGLLGSLIKRDIDLDNIDNVIRAASSMGIIEANGLLAEQLAKSFVINDDVLCLSEEKLKYFERWQNIRFNLYNLIYTDLDDFSIQTMIKHALNLLLERGEITKNDWNLTEDQLIYKKFYLYPESKYIIDRIKLHNYYSCLLQFSITGKNARNKIYSNISKFETIANEMFKTDTIANYFIDKRVRSLPMPIILLKEKRQLKKEENEDHIIFGIFAKIYKKITDNEKHNFIDNIKKSLIPDLKINRIYTTFEKYPQLKLGEW